MTSTAADTERFIADSVLSLLAASNQTPTRESVENFVKLAVAASGCACDIGSIIAKVMSSIDVRMGAGVSLIDVTTEHNDLWVEQLTTPSWTYHLAYQEYLKDKGWQPQMIHSLSTVTQRILGHLEDPNSTGTSWSRRGLVIGHVQSGKTANYTGLIARAADVGYKFIIVIAGIHNNLRRQTQERIDEAFIGLSSNPYDVRRRIGVGRKAGYPHPATLTNIQHDFNKRTADTSGWKINDFSKPIILVIKKNVTTLKALYNWLNNLNAGGDNWIRDVPMLLIDDEADNASINTNKEDINPTKTNAMIRRILNLFAKHCYVGYTATPFANIFINPDAYDVDTREELFPRDFIYCLDAPTIYFGAERVFLDDESSHSIVRTIDDSEDILPLGHKRGHTVSEVPYSLYSALNAFIVARAIRNLRGQSEKHCSMMINVSRYVSVQQSLSGYLSIYLKSMEEAVSANYKMAEAVSSTNSHMKQLKKAYDTEYSKAGFTWLQVKEALYGVFDHLKTYVINSKSDETFEYSQYATEGRGLTAIAIGGLSLSRGLTIEGLTISYMYRNTKMYDALLQMGRWFGYRSGYEDLCRVFLSSDSLNWYGHIAEAADELTKQIKQMRRDGLSPKEFGLYVRSHPDRLLITAPNKMRSGEEITIDQSYSGRLRESYIVSTDAEVNARNFSLISEYWREEFKGAKREGTEKGVIFRDVPLAVIEDFLRRFESPTIFSSVKSDLVSYLAAVSDKAPRADVLLISPGGLPCDKGPFVLNSQMRAMGKEQPMGDVWRLNKDRVASRGDEKHGLTKEQIEEAEALARVDEVAGQVSDIYYRKVRGKPLLMIHSLQPKGVSLHGPIAAFGVSFPFIDCVTTVKVVANKVLLGQNEGVGDNPDDEDDFDV